MMDKALQEAKYRHEFKYLCTEAQLAILSSRLSGILPKDMVFNE